MPPASERCRRRGLPSSSSSMPRRSGRTSRISANSACGASATTSRNCAVTSARSSASIGGSRLPSSAPATWGWRSPTTRDSATTVSQIAALFDTRRDKIGHRSACRRTHPRHPRVPSHRPPRAHPHRSDCRAGRIGAIGRQHGRGGGRQGGAELFSRHAEGAAGVKLKSVDLTVSLESLSFFLAHRGIDESDRLKARRRRLGPQRQAQRSRTWTSRRGADGGRQRQAGHDTRGGGPRAHHDVGRGACARSGRRGQERRSAADRAARRHHGRQADLRRDSALPSAGALARRCRARRRAATATTSSRASAPRRQTGVEMEALHAVAVAALTIYDMIKAVDKAHGHRADRAGRETRRPQRLPRVSSPLTVLVGIYSPFAAWNIPPAHVDRLRREFPAAHVPPCANDDESLRPIAAADVAFMAELRPAQFAAAKRLKWIHSPAAGLAGMLFPEMVRSPVVMTNSRGISAGTIAEHVIAVTLALFRKFPLAFQSQAAARVGAERRPRRAADSNHRRHPCTRRRTWFHRHRIGAAVDSVRCTRHGHPPRSDRTVGTGGH